MFRKVKQLRTLGVILDSPEMAGYIGGLTEKVRSSVSDSNPAFMASIRSQLFHSRSGSGMKRVVGQVGAHPVVGLRVEAKRGPLARALGSVK